MTNQVSPDAALHELFDAERTARRVRDRLAGSGSQAVVDAIATALGAALAEDGEERTLRLVTLARVLGELNGARVVDLLVDVLATGDPEAQGVAGDSLEALAFDRFKEVAQGVERALARLPHDSPALSELPYVLMEVPEPGVTRLVAQFLEHPSAIAVAAGIEAGVELADPSFTRHLARLEKDERTVQLDDGEDEDAVVTIGELAREAMELLAAAADEDR